MHDKHLLFDNINGAHLFALSKVTEPKIHTMKYTNNLIYSYINTLYLYSIYFYTTTLALLQ